MTFQYTIIVIVGLLNISLAANSTGCLVGQYTTIDGNCIACPPGKAGTNCSEDCQNGTYGFKCAYTCDCTDCDPVTGCPSTTINASETTISVDITTIIHPATHEELVFYIVPSTLGFLLIFTLITLICCLSKRKKERQTEPDTVAENVSTGRSDNPSYDYAGNAEDPYSFSNGSEYNTLQFAGLRRYNSANIASASIYGVGQFGSDMPENGEYDLGLTLRTVDEMRQKVIDGETNSPSEMDIYCNDEDNPYMNFRRSEASPYDLAHVS